MLNQTAFFSIFNERLNNQLDQTIWNSRALIEVLFVPVWKTCKIKSILPQMLTHRNMKTTQPFSIQWNVCGICVKFYWLIRLHQMWSYHICSIGYDFIFRRTKAKLLIYCLLTEMISRNQVANSWKLLKVWYYFYEFIVLDYTSSSVFYLTIRESETLLLSNINCERSMFCPWPHLQYQQTTRWPLVYFFPKIPFCFRNLLHQVTQLI